MRFSPISDMRADACARQNEGSTTTHIGRQNAGTLLQPSARGGLSLACAASLLAAWAILAAAPAHAQMVAWHMQARTPDWSSARSVGLIVMLVLVLCYGTVGLVRLVQRRRMHPIPSRGFPLLLVQGVSALVGHELIGVAYLAYPGQHVDAGTHMRDVCGKMADCL